MAALRTGAPPLDARRHSPRKLGTLVVVVVVVSLLSYHPINVLSIIYRLRYIYDVVGMQKMSSLRLLRGMVMICRLCCNTLFLWVAKKGVVATIILLEHFAVYSSSIDCIMIVSVMIYRPFFVLEKRLGSKTMQKPTAVAFSLLLCVYSKAYSFF